MRRRNSLFNYRSPKNNKNEVIEKDFHRSASCRCLSSKTWISQATSSSQSSSGSSDSTTHMLIPGMMGFQSAHALINRERVYRGRESMTRNTYLDRLCSMQAEHMAAHGELSYTADTMEKLRQLVGSYHAGENIQRGPSVREMHLDSMKDRHRSAYKNILNRRFLEFGVGTARGKHDDKLYMVQLFRGPPTIDFVSPDEDSQDEGSSQIGDTRPPSTDSSQLQG